MASTAPERPLPSPQASFIASFRALAHDLFDDYRPERHYMRGPGPKWREKHGLDPAAPDGSAQAADPLFSGSVPA